MTLNDRIEHLDDFKSLRLFEHISNTLYNATDADAETFMQHMPHEIAASPEIQLISQADPSVFDKALPNKDAVAFARESLKILAADPATTGLVSENLDNWKDDSMIAGTILAIGGAISLVLLLATSEITYDKQNGLKIGIGSIKDKDQVDARRKLIESLFKIIPSLKSMLGKEKYLG